MSIEITQDYLKSLFSYDPETGVFMWLTGRWAGKIGGWNNGNGYLRVGINGKQYFCHRLAWLYVYGKLPEIDTDHINGVKTDNRIVNLRACLTSENTWNSSIRRDNSSGFKGVDFHKATGKWRARLKTGNNEKYFGLFDTPAAASVVRESNARKAHGEFYRENK